MPRAIIHPNRGIAWIGRIAKVQVTSGNVYKDIVYGHILAETVADSADKPHREHSASISAQINGCPLPLIALIA
ncbi:MAG: hypothetical protein BWY09_01898 [Candidatus Hydrogenedentes bacterium ADurb.Bin179]|nr:MAG: hypothetical protein BWY09_01898 [Candidatus Hydrogenedentes bacterium ADurb.Bin179]